MAKNNANKYYGRSIVGVSICKIRYYKKEVFDFSYNDPQKCWSCVL